MVIPDGAPFPPFVASPEPPAPVAPPRVPPRPTSPLRSPGAATGVAATQEFAPGSRSASPPTPAPAARPLPTPARGSGGTVVAEEFEDSVPASRAVVPQLEPGTLVGQYELIRELGRGGMGVVYLARDIRHDRSVAPVQPVVDGTPRVVLCDLR